MSSFLDNAQQNKTNIVFISSEDFETILIESSRASQFEQIIIKLGYSDIHWVCVLRNQWDYFNSLYSQVSGDGACLNYSAMGHDAINFGETSFGNGTIRWRFIFDYDFYIDKFLKDIEGSFSIIGFDDFVKNDIVGIELINDIIKSTKAEKIFWKSDLDYSQVHNARNRNEDIEINYLANFLGIEMSQNFFEENSDIFAPLIKFRISLYEKAKLELKNKFLIKYPRISKKLN